MEDGSRPLTTEDESAVGGGINAISQSAWISRELDSKLTTCGPSRLSERIALAELAIEEFGKAAGQAVSDCPLRTDISSGVAFSHPELGPASQPRQRVAEPSYLAGVEKHERAACAERSRKETAHVMRPERSIGQYELRFIGAFGDKLTVTHKVE